MTLEPTSYPKSSFRLNNSINKSMFASKEQIENAVSELTQEDLEEYVPEVNLVLDCSDNLETRKAVNRVCAENHTPLVSAAAIRWEGHLMLFDFRKPETPCYECLYPPDATEPVLNCSTSGVVGPLLGILGSMQALEAIKLLLGMDPDLNGRLLIFDGKYHQWQNFRIQKKTDCSVCGSG